jgi:hypothetical protein
MAADAEATRIPFAEAKAQKRKSRESPGQRRLNASPGLARTFRGPRNATFHGTPAGIGRRRNRNRLDEAAGVLKRNGLRLRLP